MPTAASQDGTSGDAASRQTRPKPKVNYFEGPAEEQQRAAARVPHAELSRRIIAAKLPHPPVLHPGQLTAERLQAEGFEQPLVAHGLGERAATLKALGMALPDDYGLERIVAAVGPDARTPTIDVSTQKPGPRLTLREWAAYFRTPAAQRPRLLNVVSLSLAGTPLQEAVAPPAYVRSLDLVERVWPAQGGGPKPQVLLYALLSPAGAFTDFHVDFGGSSVWYHVCEGRKIFVLVPPSRANLAAYEAWASSEQQASSFLGDQVSGALRAELGPGQTLLIPSGWPHAVVTPADSTVVGGNFLHGCALRRQCEVEQMEARLRVAPAARFPAFTHVMWHAAAHFAAQLASGAGGVSSWERQGLPDLIAALRKWAAPSHVPGAIADPQGLLDRLEALLAPEPFAWSSEQQPGAATSGGEQEDSFLGETGLWDLGAGGYPFGQAGLDPLGFDELSALNASPPPEPCGAFAAPEPTAPLAAAGVLRGSAAAALEARSTSASKDQLLLPGSDGEWGSSGGRRREAGGEQKRRRLLTKAGGEPLAKALSRRAPAAAMDAPGSPRGKRAKLEPASPTSEPPRPRPANLVPLGKGGGGTLGMGLTKPAPAPAAQQPPGRPKAPDARAQLQRLEAALDRELALQTRLASSKLQLKDGGAKVAQRIAGLRAQIASLRARLPVAAPGMREAGGAAAAAPSLMIPVQPAGEQQLPPPPPPPLLGSSGSGGSGGQQLQRRRSFPEARQRPSWQQGSRGGSSRQDAHSSRHAPLKSQPSWEERAARQEAAQRLARQREAEAAEWEARRVHMSRCAATAEALQGQAEDAHAPWSCITLEGEAKDACSVTDLCRMLVLGTVAGTTKVHDEEAGVTLRVATLLSQPANQARLAAARAAFGPLPAAQPPLPPEPGSNGAVSSSQPQAQASVAQNGRHAAAAAEAASAEAAVQAGYQQATAASGPGSGAGNGWQEPAQQQQHSNGHAQPYAYREQPPSPPPPPPDPQPPLQPAFTQQAEQPQADGGLSAESLQRILAAVPPLQQQPAQQQQQQQQALPADALSGLQAGLIPSFLAPALAGEQPGYSPLPEQPGFAPLEQPQPGYAPLEQPGYMQPEQPSYVPLDQQQQQQWGDSRQADAHEPQGAWQPAAGPGGGGGGEAGWGAQRRQAAAWQAAGSRERARGGRGGGGGRDWGERPRRGGWGHGAWDRGSRDPRQAAAGALPSRRTL